jgi:hypothetical protein
LEANVEKSEETGSIGVEKRAESIQEPLREPQTAPERWLMQLHPEYYRRLSSDQIARAWRMSGKYGDTFVDACRRIAYGYKPDRLTVIYTPMGGQPPHRKRRPGEE